MFQVSVTMLSANANVRGCRHRLRPEMSASASAPAAAPDAPVIADSPQEDFGWLDHPMFEGPSADEAPSRWVWNY